MSPAAGHTATCEHAGQNQDSGMSFLQWNVHALNLVILYALSALIINVD